MDVTFLGGAEEIGASCAVLDLEGVRLLIDCGQRMSAPPGQALPDFSHLEAGPPIQAVLLTHAHADHVGALPALEAFLPADCPILGTEATIALARVMLEDSLRIMLRYRQGEGQLPMFPPSAVMATLERFRPVRWEKSNRIRESDVRATWFPAGHILGAGMIEVRGEKETALFSGDISVADQFSVPGVFVPAIKPHLLVLESTYGNRLHAHRPAQEKRVVERVRECIAAGGHVLFPTFALGRAQEVLLLLGKAMREGLLPRIPVYADGLVRAISKVYVRFAEELSPGCRRLWEQGLHPIFPEDLPIFPIEGESEREGIARGGPCVMVASSGMLQGGASQFYARHWIGQPENLILITGYQDEESPGQALLNLATTSRDTVRSFKMAGVRTEVRCNVESFQLSAHADNGELIAFAGKLQPRLILPVHGDRSAREALARNLMAAGRSEVVLPFNGETYTLEPGPSRAKSTPIASRISPLGHWPPWDPFEPRSLDLARFHEWLVSLTPKIAWITLDELAEMWKSPQPVSDEEMIQVREAVYEQSQPYFVPDSRRPSILRVTPPENLAGSATEPSRISVEAATNILREIFPKESGLRRFGFFPDERLVQLDFQFPAAARRRYVHRLGEFTERTGWKLELNHGTDPQDLAEVLRDWLALADAPAIEVAADQLQVRLVSPGALPVTANDDFAERFERKTGFHLLAADGNKLRADAGSPAPV